MVKGTFKSHTTLSLAAWDAGPEIELEMVVTFTVQPESGDGWNDPREPAFVEDVSIRLFQTITKTELPCPSWLEERFSDDEGFRDWLMDDAREQYASAREDAAEGRREMQREATNG